MKKCWGSYDKKVLCDIRLDSAAIMLPAGVSPVEQAVVDKIASELRREMEGLLPGTVVSIGIGSAQDRPENIRQSLEQAKFALETVRTLAAEGRIYRYDQLGIYKLLFKVDRSALEDYYNEVLSTLAQYDKEHEGDLLNTLSQVLEEGGNFNNIANKLYVHRNTLKNRLKKIETITGCTLANPRDRVKLEFALLPKNFWGCENAQLASQ